MKFELAHRGHAEAFAPKQLELREGDRVAFTGNDHEKARVNGLTGTIAHVDQARGTLRL